jgi:hypothetical protein
MLVALVIIDGTSPTKVVPMQFVSPELRYQPSAPLESDRGWAMSERLFDKFWRDLDPISVDSPTACAQDLAPLRQGQPNARLIEDAQCGSMYLGKIVF